MSTPASFQFECAATFRRDRHPGLRADCMPARKDFANPPFNDFNWFCKDDAMRFFALFALIPLSASGGEKVAEGRMRCLRERGEKAGVRCRNDGPPRAAPTSTECSTTNSRFAVWRV